MRVVICWSTISGYMAGCWRKLAAKPGVELLVVAFSSGVDVAFDPKIMGNVPCRLLNPQEAENGDLIASVVKAHKPDVIVSGGWNYSVYTNLAFDPELSHVRFAMGMDTPRRDTWRQRVARLKIGRFLDRLDRVVVAGERAWQYARFLRIGEEKIRRGLYSYDDSLFVDLIEQRLAAGPWPRRFLFMGRYVEDKGLLTLLDAYTQYRQGVSDPWTLTCMGIGVLKDRVAATEGVTDRGFVQPVNQPAVLAEHGVFILPSRFEPWGVVVAEAAATGLPVICSEMCGAGVEIVRDRYNGLRVATGNVQALARALRWAHDHADQLPEMGRRAAVYARAHSATVWADIWYAMMCEMVTPEAIRPQDD